MSPLFLGKIGNIYRKYLTLESGYCRNLSALLVKCLLQTARSLGKWKEYFQSVGLIENTAYQDEGEHQLGICLCYYIESTPTMPLEMAQLEGFNSQIIGDFFFVPILTQKRDIVFTMDLILLFSCLWRLNVFLGTWEMQSAEGESEEIRE